MFRNIVVAIDGSPTSNRGLKVAAALAQEQKAKLHVVHVVEEPRVPMSGEAALYLPEEFLQSVREGQREAGRKVLARAEALARKEGATVNGILTKFAGRSVAEAILSEVRTLRADLIVLGTHGRRGLSRLVTGSDAEEVLRQATVPVLLVRAPSAERPARAAKPRTARADRDTAAVLRSGPGSA
jgi:nucleotide-binding universal stress UspA family protein